MAGEVKDAEGYTGVWRTIRGHRVFIRNGEELGSAMARSGKFKNLKREDVVKGKHELERRRLHSEAEDLMKAYSTNRHKFGENYWRDKWVQASSWEKEERDFPEHYDNPQEAEDISDLQGRHIEGYSKYLRERNHEIPKEIEAGTYTGGKDYYDPRQAVKDALTNGDFTLAHNTMDKYGLMDEKEEFLGGVSSQIASDYRNWDYQRVVNNEYALNFGDSSQGYKDTKDVPFSEKEKAVREARETEIPSYTKSGNLNYKAFGIERTPEGDFSDDGTRFYSYMLNNGMEMTVAKGGDDIYLSLRHPYDKEISYEEYSSLPHYNDLDRYNGVAKGSVNLNEVVKASNAYMNEYNELKKSKGLAVDNRSTYERRIDDIDNAIKSSKEYADYHRNYYKTGDYSRGRYHDSEARRYDKKVDRLEASKFKLMSEHAKAELRGGLKSRIEKYNDQELHDTAKGWTYPIDVDESDKKTIRELKSLAREEIKNRTAKQDYPYAKNYDPWKKQREVDDNGYHTEPSLRKKDMENDLKVMERLSKNSGGDLSKNNDYQSLRKQYESEFGHPPRKKGIADDYKLEDINTLTKTGQELYRKVERRMERDEQDRIAEKQARLGINITEAPKEAKQKTGLYDKPYKTSLNRSVDLGLSSTSYTAGKDAEILDSITGQLSDGIWENSPNMDRYWKNIDFSSKDGKIVANVPIGYYADDAFRDYGLNPKSNPYSNMDDERVRRYLADKAKQIVKQNIKDYPQLGKWDRNNNNTVDYMGGHNTEGITVADVYSFYDRVKGRPGKNYNTYGKTSVATSDVDNIKAQVERYKKRKGNNSFSDNEIISSNSSKLKYSYKNANEEDRRKIKAELQSRGYYLKGDKWYGR